MNSVVKKHLRWPCRSCPSADLHPRLARTIASPSPVRSRLVACLAAIAFLASGCGTRPASRFKSPRADLLLEAHTRAFCQVQNGRAWFKKNTEGGQADFWKSAEMMEMELDAFERTGQARQLALFEELFQGFIADHGADWSANTYNDDIMWMVIACARGYLLTGHAAYREAARRNFDACSARAWSGDLGGGLWWRTDNQSKNACVNGPAAIAAALLARACHEPAYRVQAKNLFLWERATLFDPATGQVYDHIRRDGGKRSTALTYNQGTFVGAANLLGYTNEALLAATYTMNHLCHDGLLPASAETGDAAGFNGICARWIARFTYERHASPALASWLQKNADDAWQARRPTDNLSWCRWPEPTPAGPRDAWSCSSAVVLLQVVVK